MNNEMRCERMVLKEKAINYFKGNNIPKTIEKSLNELFLVVPDDAYGYLSKYFENLSKDPQLTKITAYESTGDLGTSALSIKLFTLYRNEEIEFLQVTMPNDFNLKTGEALTFDNAMLNLNLTRNCIEIINQVLSKKIIGMDPRNYEQTERILRDDAVDRQMKYEDEKRKENENEIHKDEMKREDAKSKVTSGKNKKIPALLVVPDDPPEIICPELHSHFSLSITLAIMASLLEKQNFYKYTLNRLSLPENTPERITLPAISLLSNGKGLPGKCQMIKKCLIIPNGLYSTSNEVAADLKKIHIKIWSSVQSKFPAALINDRCELIPAFDKPEQFLDIIVDVLKESELDEKMKIVLDIGANGIFDFNKGKYEVIIGQFKSSDELVMLLKEMIDHYPSIVGLINPLRKQDIDAWKNLVKTVSDRCWIIGRGPQVIPRVHKISETPQYMENFPLKVSMIGINIDGYSVYSDYISCMRQLTEGNQKVCIWLEDLCGQNWVTDLACGLNPYLLVLPNLRCSSGSGKLDRWAELMSPSEPIGGLHFPVIHQESITEIEESA